MKNALSIAVLITILAALIPGCDSTKYPTEALQPQNPASTALRENAQSIQLPQSVTLAGFTVTYNGRVLANNQTTFSYTVTGPNVDLHFRLELPTCAPALAASSPANGVTSNNDPNIDPGIAWHPNSGASAPETLRFSLTYPGTVREGIILTSVRTPSATGVGLIAGACARVFDLSGAVFTDANSNGIRDGSETGISNVLVNLFDSTSALVATLATDANGGYRFISIPDGRYAVSLDTTTVASTATRYLSATTPSSIVVVGEPDSPGNNFGFAPKSAKLINDVKFGILPTNGLTPGFWKKQLASALSGGGSPTVSKDSLLAYIARIRTLLLSEPFQLGTGNGLQAAFDILNKPVKSDLDALTQQLLALEFNWESNHGIVATDAKLQLVLIGWGEALVAGGQAVNGSATSSVTPNPYSTSSTVTDATGVFNTINKSSGGGGAF